MGFYRGKKILITGSTGFKGTWLSKILLNLGAEVTGYSLEPPTEENLYSILRMEHFMETVNGDVRDYGTLENTVRRCRPEIVIHLAAQPLVKESYRRVRETYETNVMGTVNILESVRKTGCVRSFLNVTTDKVYDNKEWCWGYRETDLLDGYDPYSNSKSCSELVTHSFRRSFLEESGTAVSTARAGNVIGGGDFAKDRIVPDCVAAARAGKKIEVRNPYSIRPYQHVLEALFAYLLIIEKQYDDICMQGEYNVGPAEESCISTGELATIFCENWGEGLSWEYWGGENPVHEASFLKLDCSKIKGTLNWNNTWDIRESIKRTVEWTKVWRDAPDTISAFTEAQVSDFMKQTKCQSF